MKKHRTRIITLFLLFFCNFSFAQNSESVIDSTYLIYQEQLKDLYIARGLGSAKNEIDSIIALYKTNEISSDDNFAQILSTLFPKNQGICFLTYFYQNNLLKIVLFEPGKVVQIKKVPISKEELVVLNQDIITSLDVFENLTDRAPKSKRGAIVKKSEDEKLFDDVVKKATEILIPDSFSEQYRQLIVMPAYNIGVFPFHLLKPYADGSYLIEKCNFSVAPSLLDIIALRTRMIKKASNGRIQTSQLNEMLENRIPYRFKSFELSFTFDNPLFVCNPKYPASEDYFFPDLPGAKQEVDSAITYSKQFILLEGKEAYKDTVISLMNKRDVVYFATHGIADIEYPMEKSYLVLSEPQPYLRAKDLMDLRLKPGYVFPELVVLSACQTGLGRFMEAGTAGLARSFLIGGSNHVVMSLWSVDDHATAYLMQRFIYHLSKPMLFTPSEQMRLAVLDTMKLFPNPAYWASFAIFGISY
jgi:CHAT domain-containing protein